ncbi:hypothetical protein [uncultured Thiothrix sp.]|uniref:hypothetical protein n=1 Tax=uncultured Thiothrix sp. TaxID=223185 RepID=UPI002604C5AB|nr:hypothetical protein [uncultured Thiothrix sp.]
MSLLAVWVTSCSGHEQSGVNLEPADLAKVKHPGIKVYQLACMSCHPLAAKKEGIAPPLFGVKDQVMRACPEGTAFIQRIVAGVKAPNKY